ncbi:MAG: FlgD immunoglobulin-like domain containing protein, partial [Woeseia sp.]
GGVAGAVELPSSVSNVQIEITDASGQLVRRFDIGAQQSGVSRFNWDGRDDSGEIVADGQYEIAARVQYGNEIESVPTLIEADIASVSLGRGGAGLTLNLASGEQMSLARVRQIN